MSGWAGPRLRRRFFVVIRCPVPFRISTAAAGSVAALNVAEAGAPFHACFAEERYTGAWCHLACASAFFSRQLDEHAAFRALRGRWGPVRFFVGMALGAGSWSGSVRMFVYLA